MEVFIIIAATFLTLIAGMIIHHIGWTQGFRDCEAITLDFFKQIERLEQLRKDIDARNNGGTKGTASEPPRIHPVTGETVT